MTVAEYIADQLIQYGVTDTFGIPGGVILEVLHGMEERKPDIVPHLSYHEQMAGFAACGYAQAGNKLGVAYATRGPGILNMVGCMAEAWQESLPVLFITAHGNRADNDMRFRYNQEVDLTKAVSGFVKYAANVEKAEDVRKILDEACQVALEGRRGPVFLDFSSQIWEMQIDSIKEKDKKEKNIWDQTIADKAINDLRRYLLEAKRPVVLIGDGIRGMENLDDAVTCLEKLAIPVLSSRGSQDILASSELYYGYVGSHGCRYSNFILSKADLVIALGNRMAFPEKSESFATVFEKTKLLRFDIDPKEFRRKFSGSETYCIDACQMLVYAKDAGLEFLDLTGWRHVCEELKEKLNEYDVEQPIKRLASLLQIMDEAVYVSDVGNNEYWFSRAYELIRPAGKILCSKSFGTLGVALGRAIGAYYATRTKVICITGDQGFQYHIQELQYISHWKLPVKIVLVNNHCSGMIRDHEKKLFIDTYIHVTEESGYSVPDFEAVAKAYGICYLYDGESEEIVKECFKNEQPLLYEISVRSETRLIPNLPKGNPLQRMEPFLEETFYEILENM